MAQYLILIYGDEAQFEANLDTIMEDVHAGHRAFAAKYGAAVLGGEALESTGTSTSIRPDGAGGFTVTDGAFAETKEALGGYYLVEAADLDAAIAMGRDIPTPFGGLEVRPVMVFS